MPIKLLKTLKYTLGAAFCATLLAGCAFPMTTLTEAPGFNYKTWSQKPTAVMGVSQKGKLKTAGASVTQGQIFMQTIHAHRSKINLISPITVYQGLGKATYLAYMNYYQNNGYLTSAQLQTIHKVVPTAGYVILARVRSNQVSTSENANSTPDGNGYNDINYTLTSTRTITADVSMYDLLTQKAVWYGTESYGESNSNTDSESTQPALILGPIQFGGGAAGVPRNFPTPPSTDQVLRVVIYFEFAGNLPYSSGE